MARIELNLRRTWAAARLAPAVALLVAAASFMKAAAGADVLSFEMKSGRTFHGVVDPSSDANVLRLSSGKEGVSLVRPIEWSSVVGVRQGDKTLDVETLRREAARSKDRAAAVPQPEPMPSTPQRRLQLWRTPTAGVQREAMPDVRSIAVDAYLANWDADVEADGVLLSVEVYDAEGNVVPVAGTLQAELVGERYPPLTRGNAIPVLGRWTKQVVTDDFAAGGLYRARLEFQALHPDYQLWLSRYALVHVRLMVPGRGTFEASVDAVALRGFTPVRERIQQAFGTRFLPTEATGCGHRESGIDVP